MPKVKWGCPMINLKQALQDKIEDFIKEHEGEEVEKETLQRYIDTSATPLDIRKEGQSKFFQG